MSHSQSSPWHSGSSNLQRGSNGRSREANQHRRDFAALEARRFEAAERFAHGEPQAAAARVSGVTTAPTNQCQAKSSGGTPRARAIIAANAPATFALKSAPIR
jgi:hypothetical protein